MVIRVVATETFSTRHYKARRGRLPEMLADAEHCGIRAHRASAAINELFQAPGPHWRRPGPKDRIRLRVEVAPVGYSDHENFAEIVVYLVPNAPISHADSPNALLASYFQATKRPRVGGKR